MRLSKTRTKSVRGAVIGLAAAAVTLSMAGLVPASADKPAVLTGKGLLPAVAITLPGGQKITSFDISFVASGKGVYLLADRTNKAVDVVDTSTNAVTLQAGQGLFVGVSAGGNDHSGPNGAMTVGGTIWAGDGDSTLKILDLTTGALINTISTGGTARLDEMCYDPIDNVAMTANDADTPPFISFHDGSTGAVTKQIKFDGLTGDGPNATNGIEQCQYNRRDGNFYLALPEVNGPGDNSQPGVVVVFSPKSQTILAVYTIPLSACSGPQGMAIGPAPQILLGCNGGPSQPAYGSPTAIINDGSTGGIRGSVYATLLNWSGNDEVDYNAATNEYTGGASGFNPPPPNGTASCTTSPPTAGPQVLHQASAEDLTVLPNVPTGLFNKPGTNCGSHGGNHSVASDQRTNHTYVPIASTAGLTVCSAAGGVDSQGCILVLIPQTTASHDFNNDGRSDVAWRDTSGDVGLWLLNGTTVLQSAGVGSAPTVWSIVGQRDFNGDGFADFLWKNTSGDVGMWLMRGTTIETSAGVGSAPSQWAVAGTGDFDGDGKGDILWHDTSGNVGVWIMNGTTVVSSAGIGNAPPSVWSIAGTGDFNSDGKADILWIDTSGDVGIWFMNGTTVTSAVGVGKAPPGWSIVGTGDFNGDGNTDILWRDSSGDMGMWLMDGSTIVTASGIGSVPSVWSVAQTGDYNGDGMSDVLWRNTSTGDVGVWLMNGTAITTAAGIGNTSPSVWSIQGFGAD